MLPYYKKKTINMMVDKLKTTGEGAVTIKRRKAFYFKESGECDHEGRFTLFGQIYQ
jgi:hypothetical protein